MYHFFVNGWMGLQEMVHPTFVFKSIIGRRFLFMFRFDLVPYHGEARPNIIRIFTDRLRCL